MTTDQDLDVRVRSILRDALDREWGPDPVWAGSPAAQRVLDQDRTARQRWPLRLLAVAAVIGAIGGGALLAGTLAEPPDDAGVAGNGWIALTISDTDPSGAKDKDIWFLALDQEARRVIGTDTDGIDQLCPAFSPDGRSLAYGRVDALGSDEDAAAVRATYRDSALVIADVGDDGTVADRLTVEVGDELPPPCPVWSPGGDQLAFGVPRTSPINPDRSGDGSEVWVVRLSDLDITVLPDLLTTDLEWSPDGSLLAIVGGVETASGEGVIDGLQDARIHLYDAATRATRQLDGTLGAGSITWSPDGRQIAYTTITHTAANASQELRVIDVQTGGQEVLAGPFDAFHGIGPVWSPDGQAIVYQRCHEIPCGREGHEVVLVMPGDRSGDSGVPVEVVIPSFQQTAQGSGDVWPYRVTWSPDGQYLLYLAWTNEWTEAGDDAPGGPIDPMVVAVPIDPDRSAVILSRAGGLRPYEGYPDTPRVSIQSWGRDQD